MCLCARKAPSHGKPGGHRRHGACCRSHDPKPCGRLAPPGSVLRPIVEELVGEGDRGVDMDDPAIPFSNKFFDNWA
eukprot:5482843-Alexandrium_andersonii.AAC.1